MSVGRDREAQSGTDDRRSVRSWRTEQRVLLPLGVAWFVGAVIIAVAAGRENPQLLFFDPSFSAQNPAWYVGVVSQLGILGWTIAVLSAGWSSWFAGHVGRTSAARFLRNGAIATAILLADDLLEVHAVAYQALGVPKIALQVLVVAPAGFWVLRYSPDILRTRWPVLAAALAALAGSLIVEQLTGNSMGPRATVAEDGAKFLGVLAWATYFALTSMDISRSVLGETHTKRWAVADAAVTETMNTGTADESPFVLAL